MKRSSILFAIFLCGSLLKASAQESPKTLFNTPQINQVGIYFAPELQYGQLKNGMTPFGGGSLMFLINQRFAIGASMQHSLQRDYSPSGVSPLYLHSGFGGLKMEYTIKPMSAIHLSFPLLIGMGTSQTDSSYSAMRVGSDSAFRMNQANRSNYVVIQPGVQIEANLIKYTKVYIGANYRFAMDAGHSNPLAASTMQGFSVYAGIKVGLFDYTLPKKKVQ